VFEASHLKCGEETKDTCNVEEFKNLRENFPRTMKIIKEMTPFKKPTPSEEAR
jgi:hypothetical protein